MNFHEQGRGVAKALHTTSNYHDQNYQRFIRIFSLQLQKQPIDIQMKQMFTFNHTLLKSVSNIIHISLTRLWFDHIYLLQTIVLISTYVAIIIQFQISEENVSTHLKTNE